MNKALENTQKLFKARLERLSKEVDYLEARIKEIDLSNDLTNEKCYTEERASKADKYFRTKYIIIELENLYYDINKVLTSKNQ
jgi:hypothetical protein